MLRKKNYCPNYPNQADPCYYEQKLLDIATAIVSGIGLIVAILFLISLA